MLIVILDAHKWLNISKNTLFPLLGFHLKLFLNYRFSFLFFFLECCLKPHSFCGRLLYMAHLGGCRVYVLL